VFSRRLEKASVLAELVEAEAVNDLAWIRNGADFYIVAVHDDAIGQVAAQIGIGEGIIAHTSGAVSSKVLEMHDRYGIFYPLQSFTITEEVNWAALPFCIDGSTQVVEDTLWDLAATVNNNLYRVNDKQRTYLHLAAVMSNNFSNHLFAIAEQICADNELSFDIIKPLILESVKKVDYASPADIQTGPAKRGDERTIQKHLDLLNRWPPYKGIYRQLSDSILDFYEEE